ncbi:MAG: hypothetical protein E7552_04940 [Ruminococcaceae bacterium]|nr:hypothetical protein [Oscillospiraceae bacterium]
MKRVISIVLTTALLLSCASGVTLVGSAAVEGYYTYYVEAGGATISIVDDAISGEVIIPPTLGGYPVTAIGEGAFWNSDVVVSITIPASVTTIGDGAFSSCDALVEVNYPENITDWGEWVFSNCTSLPSFVLPDGVQAVTAYMFNGCSALTEVILPDSVVQIDEAAFMNCESLAEIAIPDGVTEIGDNAFYGCHSLTAVAVPDKVIHIGTQTFAYCDNLASLTVSADNATYHSEENCIIHTADKTLVAGCYTAIIPADGSVTVIGDGAFDSCLNLTSVTIPESVTRIGEMAFFQCGITELTISASVTEIGRGAFACCYELSRITVAEGNGTYHSDENCIIHTADKVLLQGCNNATIPADGSVTSIAEAAFAMCSLDAITIPADVTHIGVYAFSGCNVLSTVMVADGNKTYHAVGNCLIYTKNKELIAGFKNSVIPDDGSVTSIGPYAFFQHYSLTSVAIPKSVTSIGEGAFEGCDFLATVYYGGEAADFENMTFGDYNEALLNAVWNYGTTGLLYGDVDGNGRVDSTDARLTLQYAVQKISAEDLALDAADVDGSGTVDSTDARLILQYAVQKIGKFPVEE